MPPPPSFDYYAELQVERTASSTDITSAYRRLARICHPDKNPESQEAATITFQRLQLAHETLSDPAKRARYDNTPTADWSSISDQDEDGFWYEDDGPFGFGPFPFGFPLNFFTSRFFRGQPRRDFSQREAAREYEKAENERRERVAKERRVQENKRREEEERLRQERLEREVEQAHQKSAERNRLLQEESKKQEKYWGDMGAVSMDERLRTCLHSDLCNKVQHTKKFKCTACSAKRGMIAFECPHCSAFLCQLCVSKSTTRRKKLETQEHTEEINQKPKNSVTVDCKPITKKSNKPATKKPAAKRSETKNTKQASKESVSATSINPNKGKSIGDPDFCKEEEEVSFSGGQFASDNPYDILARGEKAVTAEKSVPGASTPAPPSLSSASPGATNSDSRKPASAKAVQSRKKKKSKKVANNDGGKENIEPADKRQETTAKVAVKPKVVNAIPRSYPRKVDSRSREPSSQNDTEDEETAKPQDSAPLITPSGQQEPSGAFRDLTAGATGGYIRALSPAHGLNVGVLRQAMERFGAVKSLRITHKRNGTAHVNFTSHDSLRSAIAASPVVVSEQIAVSVVELRHCDNCGKPGHTAKTCWNAKSEVQI
ncbi:hypothetical protein diail_3617 [Diaporthe ilicicola]|nr:hypothetical protein diail_3617 [Diaporthe ilicicola]